MIFLKEPVIVFQYYDSWPSIVKLYLGPSNQWKTGDLWREFSANKLSECHTQLKRTFVIKLHFSGVWKIGIITYPWHWQVKLQVYKWINYNYVIVPIHATTKTLFKLAEYCVWYILFTLSVNLNLNTIFCFSFSVFRSRWHQLSRPWSSARVIRGSSQGNYGIIAGHIHEGASK